MYANINTLFVCVCVSVCRNRVPHLATCLHCLQRYLCQCFGSTQVSHVPSHFVVAQLVICYLRRRCPEGAQSRVLIVSHLAYNYAYGRTGPIKRIARKIKEQQSLKSFHGSSFSMPDLLSRRCFSSFPFFGKFN